jgi:hypothetical protein
VTTNSTNPLLRTEQLRRLPFLRRPVAEPGTTLVFQAASGELVWPAYPYTAGDVWWRGHRVVYVVDVGPHHHTFTCKLPAKSKVLYFDATIGFEWRVVDPVAVVRDRLADPASVCRRYLFGEMHGISQQSSAMEGAQAEAALSSRFGAGHVDLQSGVRISGVGVALSLDQAQIGVAQELELHRLKQELAEAQAKGQASVNRINQDADLDLQSKRHAYYTRVIGQGLPAMAGNILAQDPSKAAEAAGFMMSLWDKDQKVALEAMQVILDGDHVRLGEIDDAVAAAVSRFRDIVSSAGSRLGASPLLGSSASSTPEALPAGESPSPSTEPDDGGEVPK